jgi:hypothetical protein
VETIPYLCFQKSIKEIMGTLFVSTETFTEMLSGLIKSGVTFESKEKDGGILITFTGGH